MTEKDYELLLNIETDGTDKYHTSHLYHRYEPTPYDMLNHLFQSYTLSEGDYVVDYGCGKGRVDFFLSYQTKAKTIGIEYDERIYQCASENQKTAVSGARTEFVLARAETYEVSSEVNRFYFFNPFSVELLRKVMARIMESYYEEPRELLLFFYYPSKEYILYLMTVKELEVFDEIVCTDLFEGDDTRERIMIFKIKDYRN